MASHDLRRTVIVVLSVALLAGALLSSFAALDPINAERAIGARMAAASYTGTINVTVMDNADRPLRGASVHMIGNSTVWSTGEGGKVSLEEVWADDLGTTYYLWANISGYLNSTTEAVVVFEHGVSNISLAVDGGMILGRVTSPTGVVAGAVVSILDASLDPPISTVVSATDGSYMLTGVPGGTRLVVANASGYAPSEPAEVYLPVGDFVPGVDFVLVPLNGAIEGYVRHAETNQPLNLTNVSVRVGDVTHIFVTDSYGYYFTNYSLQEGDYTLTASRIGFQTATSEVSVERGNRTWQNFSLTETPTRLYGVVKSGNFLLFGANVSVVGTSHYNLSDPEGNYEIRNLSAGTYTVLAQLSGYQDSVITGVVMPIGGNVQLIIDMVRVPGAVLRGTVLDGDSGAVLTGVKVTIILPDDSSMTRYTNINGTFEFPGLVGGEYVLQLQFMGYQPQEIGGIVVADEGVTNRTFTIFKVRDSFGGFIFGFDMAHSMMILALLLTIIIFAVAVYLRIRTFQAPGSAPAIYDQAEEIEPEKEGEGSSDSEGRERV